MHGGWYTAPYGAGTVRRHVAVARREARDARPSLHEEDLLDGRDCALRLHGAIWRLHS